jgi:hypothetical protein
MLSSELKETSLNLKLLLAKSTSIKLGEMTFETVTYFAVNEALEVIEREGYSYKNMIFTSPKEHCDEFDFRIIMEELTCVPNFWTFETRQEAEDFKKKKKTEEGKLKEHQKELEIQQLKFLLSKYGPEVGVEWKV